MNQQLVGRCCHVLSFYRLLLKPSCKIGRDLIENKYYHKEYISGPKSNWQFDGFEAVNQFEYSTELHQ